LVISIIEKKSIVAFLTLPVDADVNSRKIYKRKKNNTKIPSSNAWP
jgi:hypothetical protein